MANASLDAILWDFGGVLTTSPFEAFRRYESERGLPTDFIRGINATNPDDNAWAKFESSRISIEDFDEAFRAGVLGQQEAYSKGEPQAAIDAFIAKNAR